MRVSENLLVKNKKLKLIDFAQSTKKSGEKIIYLKKRMFFDKYVEPHFLPVVSK